MGGLPWAPKQLEYLAVLDLRWLWRSVKCGVLVTLPMLNSERLGMKFADQGFVAVGCPLGSGAFMQSEANSAADKTVQLIKPVLELPWSAQDEHSLLCRSLQSRTLHLATCCLHVICAACHWQFRSMHGRAKWAPHDISFSCTCLAGQWWAGRCTSSGPCKRLAFRMYIAVHERLEPALPGIFSK